MGSRLEALTNNFGNTKTRLKGAKLYQVDRQRVNLTGVDLSEADLTTGE